MIIDERTYTVRPGKLVDYLREHLREGLPVMRRHLGDPHAYYTTETGDLNEFVHLWRYDSMAERESRRAALYADPDWLAYRARVGETGWVTHQHNRILKALEVPQ